MGNGVCDAAYHCEAFDDDAGDCREPRLRFWKVAGQSENVTTSKTRGFEGSGGFLPATTSITDSTTSGFVATDEEASGEGSPEPCWATEEPHVAQCEGWRTAVLPGGLFGDAVVERQSKPRQVCFAGFGHGLRHAGL